MNILMMTNTYTPLVGGLERSITSFTDEYRRRGHRVVIVAPTYKRMPRRERDVIRVPAIQNFNRTDFSVRLPIPGALALALKDFHPDIVHAHHPFLLGDTALRLTEAHRIPLVFTHHTLFEQYTHYLPVSHRAAERFMLALATGYANVCTRVFAPSESVAALLRRRGVKRPISVVPTGVHVTAFRRGSRARARAQWKLPASAFVVGHLGRLAKEKNVRFLTRAVAAFLKRAPQAHFVVVGQGPMEPAMRRLADRAGVGARVHFIGVRTGQGLLDAYRAMDVFAFSSQSETQGLVLIEAMAAGVPVVAVDAPGVREVVRDGVNGRLLPTEQLKTFASALQWVAGLSAPEKRKMQAALRESAAAFSVEHCADRALAIYGHLRARLHHKREERAWVLASRHIATELKILKRTAYAATELVNVGRSSP